jgi:hypothetical protein
MNLGVIKHTAKAENHDYLRAGLHFLPLFVLAFFVVSVNSRACRSQCRYDKAEAAGQGESNGAETDNNSHIFLLLNI